MSNVVEDSRVDTNLETPHNGEHWAKGDGNVKDVGVDNPTSHQSSAGGKGKVNSVRYGSALTRAQFASEGWASNGTRAKENEYLQAMDSDEVKGEGKSTRNLKTAGDFTERFVKAYGVKHSNVDISKVNSDKLKAAIIAANPSVFDSDGNMYKNVDFSRLNLPKYLSNYITE
jgi:hypothetical protein